MQHVPVVHGDVAGVGVDRDDRQPRDVLRPQLV
jgi:hypothetical protein